MVVAPCVRRSLFLTVASLRTKGESKTKCDVTCHTIYLSQLYFSFLMCRCYTSSTCDFAVPVNACLHVRNLKSMNPNEVEFYVVLHYEEILNSSTRRCTEVCPPVYLWFLQSQLVSISVGVLSPEV